MDRNDKLIPLNLDGNAKVLPKFEGTIYFQKTMTKTDVHGNMTVPHWFIKEHGDMIRRHIFLRTVSSKQSWTVTLSISISEGVVQVRALCGWKEFVTFHGLLKGDLLVFSLTEITKFEVHLYREKASNCRESHSQPSSRMLDDAKLSPKKAKQPDEYLATQGRTQDAPRSSGSITRRTATVVQEEQAAFATTRGSSSCTMDLKLGSDLGKFDGGDSPAHTAHDVAVVHSQCDLKPKCDTPVGSVEQTVSRMKDDNPQQLFPSFSKSSPPSFFKKLTSTGFSNTRMGLKNRVLELPTAFWRTFCKDIHSPVKLQGIGEDSPIRTVTCARHQGAKQHWRLRLTSGWREFAMENNLEVNQVLQFTLAGDSSFIVRRVDS